MAQMKYADLAQLMGHFPAVFAQAPIIVEPGSAPGALSLTEAMVKTLPLTGYLQAGESNVHGHYIGPREEQPVIHEHKGGRTVHDHEGGD